MQTSSKKLPSHQETALYEQLATLLSDIEHPKAMATFLSVFLTDTERSVLSKRLAIFHLLSQGKSYQEIKDQLHVSSATISSMAELANQPAIKQSMATIDFDKKLEELLSK